MQVHNVSELAGHAERVGNGARITQLHPHGALADAMQVVDLLEIEPGGFTPLGAHAEEHVLFVISGSGTIQGASSGGASVTLQPNSVVHIGHREVHQVRNTGSEVLRVLVSTPLLIRSERALRPNLRHYSAGATDDSSGTADSGRQTAVREGQPSPVVNRPEIGNGVTGNEDEPEQPPPDISGLLKKGSEVAAVPRSERRKPAPEREPEPVAEVEKTPQPTDGEEAQENVIELLVVFDGGSRGNPGEGYGSFMVQSPNRKPVIKRVEFGDNYTNNQAEYDSLIESLKYIIERLEATNRSPDQVQLDLRTDSDLVVNQLLGNYKVKDAGLKARHAQAVDLLNRFAAWIINWHARSESVKLLGH